MNKLHIRIMLILSAIAIMAGCSASYKHDLLSTPSTKLLKGKSIVITTPSNGYYGDEEYSSSGKMTVTAVRSAFAKFSNNVTITANCKELSCLKESSSPKSDYYVIPEILHWEERATEWSGMPDKIKVKLSIYESQNWRELSSNIISGESKWATFGGDHPQDLLPEPLGNYIDSLY
jgi:hypothetical protein